ncbi:hypothetical protein ACFFJT_14455 [Dyella flava]|uniref:Uncharacterized protein n=1 Tax=Dyella flava TaxID=1920170 RepID=A0ABS2K5M7_9GAMM|nr:hypothetical protein [Dyella flava]MBM7125995.1 hypothetical protein [Dyella flava]GLQ50920.1 hypothetical protein GCM10010872_23690 [Dyella flava]
MSSMTPAINLETALEILAACAGFITTELLKEPRSGCPNQERIEGYRQVLAELTICLHHQQQQRGDSDHRD